MLWSVVYSFIKIHDKQGNLLKTWHLFVVDQTALHFPVSCIILSLFSQRRKQGQKWERINPIQPWERLTIYIGSLGSYLMDINNIISHHCALKTFLLAKQKECLGYSKRTRKWCCIHENIWEAVLVKVEGSGNKGIDQSNKEDDSRQNALLWKRNLRNRTCHQ